MSKQNTIVLEPLAISCDNSDCSNNLHCFRRSKKEAKNVDQGTCKYCGANLIDWERIHLRSENDINYIIASLKKEWIRHYYWHVELPVRAINYAIRKGKKQLKSAIKSRLETSISPAKPFHDGFQTPFDSNNPIYYAQHATATCCRKCIEYWHGIEYGKSLDETEKNYLSSLIYKYIVEKVVNLTDEPQRVPSIRKKGN